MELTEKVRELLEKYGIELIYERDSAGPGNCPLRGIGPRAPDHLPARLGWFLALLDPGHAGASISFRAYALDLWGFGDTTKVPGRYTLAGQLRLLDGFLEQMGIMRFAIVGHGLGALFWH